MKIKNNLIIFSGLDGSGKTTQSIKLIKFLKNHEIDAKYLWLRSPKFFSYFLLIYFKIIGILKTGIGSTGKKYGILKLEKHPYLQKIWKQILLFDYTISIKIHSLSNVKKNQVIVIDRFIVDSVIDYILDCNDDNLLEIIDEDFMNKIPENSIIFYFNLKPSISYSRNLEESETVIKRRQNLYLKLCKKYNLKIIDSEQSIELIHDQIIQNCISYD